MIGEIRDGIDLLAKGAFDRAAGVLEGAAKLAAARGMSRELNEALGWAGLTYLSGGDRSKAEAIREATEREPVEGQVGLLLFRARMLSDRGDRSAASDLYKSALDSGNLSTWEAAAVLLEKSRLDYESGDAREAERDLDRAEQMAGLLGDASLLAWCKRAYPGSSSRARGSRESRGERAEDVPKLRFSLLGEFQVFRGDEPLPVGRWKRRKSASLLQYLALQPHWRAPRDRVLEVFWSDSSGTNALYVTVHDLRKGLSAGLGADAGYVKVEKGFVGLDPSLVLGSDFREFRACIQAGRLQWQADRSASLACYREARGLYGGELLSGVSGDLWVEPIRESLNQMYVEAIVRLAPHEDEPLNAWLEVLQIEPAHEQAMSNVMRLLAKSGRKNRALQHYKQYCRYLRDELGLDPAPAVEAVFHELIQNKGVEHDDR